MKAQILATLSLPVKKWTPVRPGKSNNGPKSILAAFSDPDTQPFNRYRL